MKWSAWVNRRFQGTEKARPCKGKGLNKNTKKANEGNEKDVQNKESNSTAGIHTKAGRSLVYLMEHFNSWFNLPLLYLLSLNSSQLPILFWLPIFFCFVLINAGWILLCWLNHCPLEAHNPMGKKEKYTPHCKHRREGSACITHQEKKSMWAIKALRWK